MEKDEQICAIRLTCELQHNPSGIDTAVPRFSWQLFSRRRGACQSAYRILVSSSEEDILNDRGDYWDSGTTASDESVLIEYKGKKLKSLKKFYWKVRAADERGIWGDFSSVNTFITGIIDQKEWKAKWIGLAGGANGQGILVRRQFVLRDKKISSAIAAVSGLGYYELYINGDRTGDHVLDPCVTDYSRHVLYCVFDVSSQIVCGENVVGIILGNGWYGAPRLLFQLRIRYVDGTEEEIVSETDVGWQVGRSPFLENSIFDGEIYDARREKDGWLERTYCFAQADRVKNGWIHAMSLSPPGGGMCAQIMEPIRITEEKTLNERTVLKEKKRFVYDAQQNMTGWVRIRAKAEKGDRLVIYYAENLYEDGSVNQENLRTALSRDIYIFRGNEEECYAPRFTYHGFRYIQIECLGNIEIKQVTAQRVCSDIKRTGRFSCSSDLAVKIDKIAVETERNNMHGIPTDCPQRDERMGWLNDASVRAEASVYHFNMASLYEKWIRDIYDTQDEDGAIADTAPFYFGKRPADPVCSSYLIIPWLLYLHYGDLFCIKKYYESFKKWEKYLESISEGHIVYFSRFGDWASPRTECEDTEFGSGAVSKTTPGAFLSTGYSFLNCVLLSKFAQLLGREKESEYYDRLAQEIKLAMQKKFFDWESIRFCNGSEASYAFALKIGVVPAEAKAQFMDNYLGEIKRHDYHLTTGNQCTKYLLETLTEAGEGETAFKILSAKGYPGWRFMLENGATTIWERWEYAVGKEMNSHDHPMHGAVTAWFYKYLAGIAPDEKEPGFKKIIFRPYMISGIDYAEASLESIRGNIQFSWEKSGKTIKFSVRIPTNSHGEIVFSAKSGSKIRETSVPENENNRWYVKCDETSEICRIECGSGQYEFEIVQGQEGC